MKNVARIRSVGLIVIVAFMTGCASSGCSTNPDEMSRLCAASYKVGTNKKLENHLVTRRQEADDLQQQVVVSRLELEDSKQRMAKASLKLAAVDAKTEVANKQARQIAAELNLKQRDIESRQADLTDLENRIAMLKKQKRVKKEVTAQLNQTQRDLAQTKKEIQVLNDYIRTDLLIRAENALEYD